jgi:hypothetical protein
MNRREAAVELLTSYRNWIGLAVIVAFSAGLWFGFPELPRIPREPRVFVVGVLAAVVLGYAPAIKIVEWLYAPDGTYLLDIDARDNGVAVYRLSPEKWDSLTVDKGELYRVKASADAYTCRQYWPDYDVCLGTWRGSASDLELLQDRERIDAIRETLEEQAQEGISIRMKMGAIVRSAVRNITNDLVGQYEGTAIHKGEHIERAVTDALEDYDATDEERQEREEQTGHVEEPNPEADPSETGEAAVADVGDSDG